MREGIVKLQPHEEPLRSELLSGKFTVLVRSHITSGIYLFSDEMGMLGNQIHDSSIKKSSAKFHFHTLQFQPDYNVCV